MKQVDEEKLQKVLELINMIENDQEKKQENIKKICVLLLDILERLEKKLERLEKKADTEKDGEDEA